MAQTRAQSQPSTRPRPTVARYCAALPAGRRQRVESIVATLRAAGAASESIDRGMPTFTGGERGSIAVASRAQYIAVYLGDDALTAGIRMRHPELDCGRACVRIRDSQHVPLYELEVAARQAFGTAQTGNGR